MPKTDGARVVADLKRLAEFGRYKTGVHRPTYSPDDVASRQWLADKFAEAGLDPVIDGIGNVIGRNPRAVAAAAGRLAQRDAAAWRLARRRARRDLRARSWRAPSPPIRRCAGLGVEPVAWADEEGHYGNMLGSRSFTGALERRRDRRGATSRDGKQLRDALAEAGYAGRPRERLDPARYVGYFEAHIEQGDTLEADRTAHRHRRGDHRHLELLGHRHRRAEPCRHDRDAPPQGCRGRRWCGWRARIHDRFAEIAGTRARCGRSGAS